MHQRRFLLALIAALLVSLTGQGVATARSPVTSSDQPSMSVMSPQDCMEMMMQSPPDDSGTCSLDVCIAAVMAGSSSAALLPQGESIAPRAGVPVAHEAMLLRVLSGRSMPPDLRPPSPLI